MPTMEIIKEFGLIGVLLVGMFMIYKDMSTQQQRREEQYLLIINKGLKEITDALHKLCHKEDE